MLSLPLIVPRDHLLYTTSSNRLSPFQLDTQNNNAATQQQQQQAQQQAPARRAQALHARSAPLAQLRADENIIEQRKQNVRRFGAAWLRPPGVSKTLQSKLEEEQEHIEQMEMARRDAEMRAQEELAAQQAMTAAGGMPGLHGEGVGVEGEERDLDAEVPEAEDVTGFGDDEDDEDEDEEPTQDVTFHEESLLEGSFDGEGQAALEMEDAELDGRLQDERDLGMMEADLDDDVPEAGSYEHTDTEEEDSSDEDTDDEDSHREPPPAPAAPPQMRAAAAMRSDGRNRRSLVSDESELLNSSSFLESSPAMARQNAFRNSMLGRNRRRS